MTAMEHLYDLYDRIWADRRHRFDWLERAYREHLGGVFQIKVDRLLASLRDDPRFAAMLRKMQLPE
jgi:hypothetical protein